MRDWSGIKPSRILGNRHLWTCRQINENNPKDMELIRRVKDSYTPSVYFLADSTVYADSDNLYGQVFQYDHDGRVKVRHYEAVTRFMRVPIPE